MKRISIFLLAFVAIALAAYWGCKKDSTEEPTISQSKIEERVIRSEALFGNNFKDPFNRKMTVYMPPGYDEESDVRYPVIYLLHSYPLGQYSFIDASLWAPYGPDIPEFPAEGFQAWMDNMIQKGDLKPVIVVMPDARTKYGFCFYTNSILQGNYEDFIADDLVKFIDANYKTINSRLGRAVIGHSQGGYGAIRMGLRRADVFGAVASHNAILDFNGLMGTNTYLLQENPNGFNGPHSGFSLTTVTYGMAAAWSPNLKNPPYYVDIPIEYPSGNNRPDVWARWMENDPVTMLNQYSNNMKTLQGVYIDAGDADPWMPLTVSFHNALDAKGITHKFEVYQGAHFNKIFPRLSISMNYCLTALENR